MRVIHIVKTLDRGYGGPARSVQGLVATLEKNGVNSWLVSLEDCEAPYVSGIKNFRTLRGGLGKVKDEMLALIDDVRPDIIHTHDLWMPRLHMCHVAARERCIPYVCAPRGTLEKWSLRQKRLKKWLALKTYQGYDLRHAALLHATAESEAERFKELGFSNPIVISPNGVNVPEICPMEKEGRDGRRMLFVSRMHPKKGVMELVEAWGRIRAAADSSAPPVAGWKCELVYTTNSAYERDYEAKVRKRVTELNLEEQFVFTGALDDKAKWDAYAHADLFVLPTYSENFGVAVAEALYAGVPVITTKGAPWCELASRGCGWWIDTGVEPLAVTLREAMSLEDETLREMGRRGRDLIRGKYTWNAVVEPLIEGYHSVLSKQHIHAV